MAVVFRHCRRPPGQRVGVGVGVGDLLLPPDAGGGRGGGVLFGPGQADRLAYSRGCCLGMRLEGLGIRFRCACRALIGLRDLVQTIDAELPGDAERLGGLSATDFGLRRGAQGFGIARGGPV